MSSKLKNHGCKWNYPRNWTNEEGEYIEVAHSQQLGMAKVLDFGLMVYRGGTGILKIGKTYVANNKIFYIFI